MSLIRWLGIASSPAFIRAPEGNGCAERLIDAARPSPRDALNETLLRVRTFETVEELRQALLAFPEICNEHWLIERHGHRSPARFGRDQPDGKTMAAQARTSVSATGGRYTVRLNCCRHIEREGDEGSG